MFKIDGYKYCTYLIGAMEKPKEKDDGQSQRTEVENELILRGIYPINPVRLEAMKTGMSTDEVKEKMNGWLASGNWDLFGAKSKEIWKGKYYIDSVKGIMHIPGDEDYCLISDWLTFTLHKGDIPCGSYAECGIGMRYDKPLYLITDMPKKELPKSLIQMVLNTNGEVFPTVGKYLEFIDEKYKLHKKEPKIEIEKKEEK
jgi:hypothetical protein